MRVLSASAVFAIDVHQLAEVVTQVAQITSESISKVDKTTYSFCDERKYRTHKVKSYL